MKKMTVKEHFDLVNHQRDDYHEYELEYLKELVNRLIHALFEPVEGILRGQLDYQRLIKFFINKNESVNWGALSCYVERNNGEITVVLDECSPEGCPTLQTYIQKFVKSYGWNVNIRCEW